MTFDDLEAFALGNMGMSLDDYLGMTLRSFCNKSNGFNSQREQEYKRSWEQTRFIGYWQVNAFSKKHVKLKSLMKFPWEKAKKVNIPTHKELLEIVKKKGWV